MNMYIFIYDRLYSRFLPGLFMEPTWKNDDKTETCAFHVYSISSPTMASKDQVTHHHHRAQPGHTKPLMVGGAANWKQ